jgi:hypothetical protein
MVEEPTAVRGFASNIRRRGLLGSIGAAGLTAASLIFGQADAANATISKGCCNLCYNPASGYTLAKCQHGTHYTWYCTVNSGGLHCTCCEHGTNLDSCSGVTASWYTCKYN